MYVRKIRGQEKISNVIMSQSEVEVVKRLGISLEDYVKKMLVLIAKERRWTWYLNKEKQ
jgi:hypothetical protein